MENSIKDRIQQIMDVKKLSSTRFADTAGIPRPQISHIISGRNKPSLEVITQILTKFTDINTEWLLFGVGEMYKKAQNPFASSSSLPSLFDNPPVENTARKEPEKPPKPTNNDKITPAETSINEKPPTVIRIERNVEKIIAFYSDGTFEELEAKKKS